jgi:hypothetical protein
MSVSVRVETKPECKHASDHSLQENGDVVWMSVSVSVRVEMRPEFEHAAKHN